MSMWLRLETSAGATWVGETLGVTNGSGSDTWDFDTRFAGTIKASGQEISADVVTWHNEAGRPWFGVETAAFSEVSAPTTARVLATVTSTTSTTWTVSAGLSTLMGWASGVALILPRLATGTLLSVDVDLRVARFVRWDQEPGVFHNGESFIHGCAVAAHRRPEVSGIFTEQQSAQLTQSLPDAVNPRQMNVFQDEDAVFRLVEFGAIERAKGLDLYTYSFEVIG